MLWIFGLICFCDNCWELQFSEETKVLQAPKLSAFFLVIWALRAVPTWKFELVNPMPSKHSLKMTTVWHGDNKETPILYIYWTLVAVKNFSTGVLQKIWNGANFNYTKMCCQVLIVCPQKYLSEWPMSCSGMTSVVDNKFWFRWKKFDRFTQNDRFSWKLSNLNP